MTEHHPADARADNPEVGHEHSDVSVRGVLVFAVGLVVIAVVIHVTLWWLFDYFATREAKEKRAAFPLATAGRGQLPHDPRLEAITGELTGPQLRAVQEERLRSYGWVDEKAGIAHVPIEKAMHLVVERFESRAKNASKDKVLVGPADSNSGRMLKKGEP